MSEQVRGEAARLLAGSKPKRLASGPSQESARTRFRGRDELLNGGRFWLQVERNSGTKLRGNRGILIDRVAKNKGFIFHVEIERWE